MQLGVISDIHGNYTALQAALEDLTRQEVGNIVCLGDALQGGCQPREVAGCLKELGCPVILGNADAFVLEGAVGGDSGETVSDDMRRVRDWTVEQLGDEGLEILRSFVPTHEIELNGAGTLLCFHGSPRSYHEVLLPETPRDEVRDALSGQSAEYNCGGHTHLQWTVRVDDRTFFNPGSIGAAYNRYLPAETFHFDARAEFALVSATADGFAIEFKSVPFDLGALEEAAVASGHPFGRSEAARFRPPS